MDTPLQQIRNERSLTRAAVARALNTDKAHYGRIEGGYAKIYKDADGIPTKAQIMRASPEFALKIAAFFGNAVSIDQILFPEKYCPEVAERFRAAQALVENRNAVPATAEVA